MAMSIILGLTAAIGWGVTDFLARYAARQLGAYRSLFFLQAFGLGFLSALCLVETPPGRWSGSSAAWSWAALAGSLSAVAALALYRSFEKGKLAVVAPISA